MDTAADTYGGSILVYWPTIVYSLLPIIAGAIYDQIIIILNNFECHRTPVIFTITTFIIMIITMIMFNNYHFRLKKNII